jgi:hypothetical protein
MKHEFPTEWHSFLHPASDGDDQELKITLGQERFPFFVQHRDIIVTQVDVLAKTAKSEKYHLIISATDKNNEPMKFNEETTDDSTTPPVITITPIQMPQSATYGDLKQATLPGNEAGIDIEQFNVKGQLSLKLKHNEADSYRSLATNPGEVTDIFLVLHYHLAQS